MTWGMLLLAVVLAPLAFFVMMFPILIVAELIRCLVDWERPRYLVHNVTEFLLSHIP